MNDIEITIGVTGDKEIESAVKSTQKLEGRINSLVKAQRSGKISQDQLNKALKEVRKTVDGQFSSWQKAKAAIDSHKKSLQENQAASDKAAESKAWFAAQRRRIALIKESARMEAKAAAEVVAAAQRVANSQNNLKRQYVAGYAAFDNTRRKMRELQQAMKDGIITTEQYATYLKTLRDQHDAAAAAAGRLGGALGGSNKRMSRGSVLTQQAGYQIGDFLVQVQSGTNALVAFGQQATQMVGTLTLLGGKFVLIGTILGVVIPLVTAIGAAWMRSKGASDSLTTAVDALTKATQTYNSVIKKYTISGLKDLKELYGEVDEAVIKLTNSQKMVAQIKTAQELTKTIARLKTDLGSRWYDAGLSDAASRVLNLRTTFNLAEQDAISLGQALDRVYAAPKGSKDQAKALQVVSDYLQIIYKNAEANDVIISKSNIELLDSINEIIGVMLSLEESGPKANWLNPAKEAANSLWEGLVEKANEYNELARDLRTELGDAAVNALELAGVDLASPISDAAKEAAKLAGKLKIGLATAFELARKMDAANAAVVDRWTAAGNSPYGHEDVLAPRMTYGSGAGFGELVRGSLNVPKSIEQLIAESNKKFADDVSGSSETPDGIGAFAKSLIADLSTADEKIELWRETSLANAAKFNEKELAMLAEHGGAKALIDEQYNKKVQELEDARRTATLSGYASLFGAIGNLMGSKGKKLLQIQAALDGASVMISSYKAAADAAAETPTVAGKLAVWAGFVAQGISTVAKIKSIGSSGNASAGGSGGGGGISTAGVGANNASTGPVKILFEGLEASSLYSGEQISGMFDALFEENKERGYILQVAT